MQQERVRRTFRRAGRFLFGDRLGLALFLGTLCFSMLYWRAGIFITDTVTLERGLAALVEGRLWVEPATGEYLQAPGAATNDGYVYVRNYGQLVLSLPALWGLQLLDAVANLRVGLTALWHLLVLAFVLQVGSLLGYREQSALAGSIFVVLSFLGNVALATTVSDPSLPLLALQVTTVLATAATTLLVYRLVQYQYDRRLGVIAALGAVVATPVAFWAVIPKRHLFNVLTAIALLYVFARSRESDGQVALPAVGPVPLYRASAYALVGLLTWINAQEGLYVFFALVLVDIPTAPANDRRTLGFVAAVFALSLVPVFVTNALVTGDVLRPPRTLSGGGGVFDGVQTSPSTGASGGSGGGGGGSLPFVAPILAQVDWFSRVVLAGLSQGFSGALQSDDMYRTFVRSNVDSVGAYGASGEQVGFRGVNLAILEAAPVLGATVASAITATVWRVQNRVRTVDPTAVLAGLLMVAYLVTKAHLLPFRVQITVRYLLPLYPLGVYLLARSQVIRAVVSKQQNLLGWTYAASVCLGTQVLLVVFVVGQYSTGEAARLHALLGFVLAVAVLGAVLAAWYDDRLRPVAAVTLGLAAGAGTVFVLLAGLYHFSFTGEYVLPVVDVLAERLSAAG